MYKWQKKRRGSPSLDLRPRTFVIFLQNHDQLANSVQGSRVHQLTSPGKYKAVTALMFLAPNTPMLFQDHMKFLRQFRSLAHPRGPGGYS